MSGPEIMLARVPDIDAEFAEQIARVVRAILNLRSSLNESSTWLQVTRTVASVFRFAPGRPAR